MIKGKLKEIDILVDNKKIDQAQVELSKLGSEFYKDPEYLYLRSKIFYLNKLYYIAVDTLLIALEFEQNNKIYQLLSDTYKILGNENLSKGFLNSNLRQSVADELKGELSGIYRKKN